MSPQDASIINYALGLFIMTAAAFAMRQKARSQPLVKIMGMQVRTLLKIAYAGILIYLVLILSVIFSPPQETRYIEKPLHETPAGRNSQ